MDAAEQRNTQTSRWAEIFDQLTLFFSGGSYESEILNAKKIFFDKLGRSHEIKEDFYESVSQSFLEWYIFDYPLENHGKPPALCFVSLGLGTEDQREFVEKLLFHHWSIFEVESMDSRHVYLQDLLFGKTRCLIREEDNISHALWKVKKDQLVQARLFPSDEESKYFSSHLWLHPDAERELLKKICEKLADRWGLHRDFLKSCLETLVRSLGLHQQISAIQNRNWLYRELENKYAQT